MPLGAHSVLAKPAAASGPTTYISDTFTRANADLHGVAPETTTGGATWAKIGGADGHIGVVSNKCKCTVSISSACATVNAGHADFTLTVDLDYKSAGNFGVIFRCSTADPTIADQDSCYVYALSSGALALWTTVATTFVQIGSNVASVFTNGNTYAIKIVASGTTVSVYVDNVIKINAATVTANSSRTGVGMFFGSDTTTTIDNFLVTS